jgi:hypothetical protein
MIVVHGMINQWRVIQILSAPKSYNVEWVKGEWRGQSVALSQNSPHKTACQTRSGRVALAGCMEYIKKFGLYCELAKGLNYNFSQIQRAKHFIG